GTRNAFPGTEPRGQTLAGFVLDEHVHVALEDEEYLLDLMGVWRVALAGRHKHDRKGKIFRGNNRRIAVLAGAAGADKPVLRALITFDLGVLEGCPIGLAVAEAPDVFLHDLLDRHTDELGGAGVSCDGHSQTPLESVRSKAKGEAISRGASDRLDCSGVLFATDRATDLHVSAFPHILLYRRTGSISCQMVG